MRRLEQKLRVFSRLKLVSILPRSFPESKSNVISVTIFPDYIISPFRFRFSVPFFYLRNFGRAKV